MASNEDFPSLAALKHYVSLPRQMFERGLAALQPAASEAPAQVVHPTANPLTAITDRDINRAMDMGMAFSGGGLGIKAYHGSPHSFEKFDLSKIGIGEGAQSYGHGLYFAEHPNVAENYRIAGAASSPEQDLAMKYLEMAKGNKDIAREMYIANRVDHMGDMIPADPDVLAAIAKPPGHMYEVNINADPAHLVDWDKPLSQQHPNVQAKVNQELAAGDVADLRNYIRSGGDRELAEAGIPGIKYLDRGSRSAGEGSRNYVLFNDQIIDIVKKYGLAGLLSSPLMAGASGDQKQ